MKYVKIKPHLTDIKDFDFYNSTVHKVYLSKMQGFSLNFTQQIIENIILEL